MNEQVKTEHIATSKELERCPFPIPFGWFVIDLSNSINQGEMRSIQAFDQEWILFRGEDGSVGVTDPFCPHLGAHIAHGGEVVGNNLRCPFHHWQFDSKGWCKDVPYAKNLPPICQKQAVLRALPTQERYGLIWAWYHPDAIEPTFAIPCVPELESEDYVETRHGAWEIGTCIQEIGENGVDFAHLKFLHGAPEVPPGTGEVDGYKFISAIGDGVTTDITGVHHGPGVQVMKHNRDGVTVLMLSTPIPVTKELTLTRMHFTFKNYPEGSKERILAEHIYTHSIGAAEGEESAGFEAVDMPVWNNKKYRHKPILCDGDGPIAKWRKYFRQFYAEELS